MSNESKGNTIGAGVGPDEKWFLRSRGLAAKWMPVVSLIFATTGLGEEAFGQIEILVEAVFAGIGAVLGIWHYWRPDGAQLRLVPKIPANGEIAAMLALVSVIGLLMPGCAFLGWKGATLEQQFREVDAMTTVALEAGAATLRSLRDEGVELPRDVRNGLRVAVRSLRVTRYEVRRWVDECGDDRDCDKADRIRLGMETMESIAALVNRLVMEAQASGE